ncbi:MAG: hypothetical protein A3C50_03060 [Candidatus Staskawiczbacteria bacterium RIFCSPHIGHO2_02_FULL_43_16]|uniref:Rhodanese domain-containing protein n=1 Tax=Candidatus Staskawiczbacteria bacterium RIFCSPHIGHO2_01_FULL_41_41 TaxID=1802203 RepID=A0A1G2HTV8_9BACT|nr:MAG: hypothetical protein A2822_02930 [Candidatus Staskawiczbacteria bacterium RIFCSPHIGHO2_01_FULL_41_41]OGZ68682.1 MAG: hypothetical protein A3C50_03060 [Candidatus Staskawiczbacteria bacterium RIFCSPHIGHO2_02_FULL_43_16]OGZ75145.1 MAG: hypothetical protein A3A12_00990 [Candidatus Staskawiczbacteria bacterium RIFCSPLOWO2_01_FULL_43_17b]
MGKNNYTVILFYKFTKIKNPAVFRDKNKKIAANFGLMGRLLIAPEGMNGTFEGTTANIKKYIKEVRKQAIFKDVAFKQSAGHGKAFTKLTVKTRPETVTLGVGDLNVKKNTSKMVTAAQLQKMYENNEDFVVLDLRNDYEIQAGYFEKTVNPGLRFFRELPEKIKDLEYLKSKKVITVCTGDIRCEKGTCLLKKEGFENIYQLKDGIHTYMKKYPAKRFKGTLFVFDNRIVTPVVDAPGREVVAKCAYCATKCEEFYNDDSVRPSRKVVCCSKCFVVRKKRLRPAIPV